MAHGRKRLTVSLVSQLAQVMCQREGERETNCIKVKVKVNYSQLPEQICEKGRKKERERFLIKAPFSLNRASEMRKKRADSHCLAQ